MTDAVNIDYLNQAKDFLQKNFADSLSEFHISTLGNMLGIHYSLSQEVHGIGYFLSLCKYKIIKYIDEYIVLGNDFSTTLSIFVYVIKIDNDETDREEKSLKNEIAQNLITLFYPDMNPSDKSIATQIFHEILKSKNISDSMDFIYSNPNFIKDKIKNINTSYTISKAIDDINQESLSFSQSEIKKQIKFNLYNITTTIITTSTLFAGCMLAGFAGPLLIIPSTIFAIFASNKINQSINQDISTTSKIMVVNFKTKQKNKERQQNQNLYIDTNTIMQNIKAEITQGHNNKKALQDIQSDNSRTR